MKHIEEYLNDVIKVEPLGKLTTMEDKLYGMSGEMIYIDGKYSGIFISHADYVNWLERQDAQNPKFRIGDTIKKKGTDDIVTISDIDLKNREYKLSNPGFIPFKYEYLWELVEQKPAEYEKPLLEKFKQAIYDCAWGKVTCKVEGESQKEYANRWAEQLLSIVRDWADNYIDSKEDTIARRAYDKGKQAFQKPTWSEKDENMFTNALDMIEWYAGKNENKTRLVSNWLESLKERITK
jgi:hypothetical protein